MPYSQAMVHIHVATEVLETLHPVYYKDLVGDIDSGKRIFGQHAYCSEGIIPIE